MKNLLAFFIFCSISISSFAQLQIGLSSGLGLNYRTTEQMKFDDFSNTIYSAETKYTRMKTSNYHSINFNYRFNKNISIESGIEYLNRGYQIKDLKLKYRFSTDTLNSNTDEGDVYKTYFYDINTSIAVFYKF